MKLTSFLGLAVVGLLATSCAQAASVGSADSPASVAETPAGLSGGGQPLLKAAKLNIEHNATDGDTGFQGFVDGEGWQSLVVSGPGGEVLAIEGRGALAGLGLTELFFETVEPTNANVPIPDLLALLPEGSYTMAGPGVEAGEAVGPMSGVAWLTHAIPAGPELLTPAEDAVVSPDSALEMSWKPVTQTIDGAEVAIIAYQLIVEKNEEPPAHMIGKIGLSMVLPPSVTSIAVPREFLEPGTGYSWEVLAIEESGNQTLSSGEFQTE